MYKTSVDHWGLRSRTLLALLTVVLTCLLCSCSGFVPNLSEDGQSDGGEASSNGLVQNGGASDQWTGSEQGNGSGGTDSAVGQGSGNGDAGQKADLGNGAVNLAAIPAYNGQAAVEINGNQPVFTSEELDRSTFEDYSELDDLGRCGPAFALIGEELMPHEPRGDISDVHPSGWKQRMYDFVDGRALYNRSHLIAFKLAGENANEENLITGTRYMNATGMTEYEDQVADYVWSTGNHVLYRVTPIFNGDELVARGVHMEAQSIEDDGEGVSFNVYVYNVQPGVLIDYDTGENWLEEENSDWFYDDSPYLQNN